MKVVVKTVANATFDLEIEPAMKVSEVKAKIEDQQGAAFPKDSMTLIYRGKVLQDDKTVGEAEIAENTFMVVMIKKPTAPKVAAPPPATPAAPAAEPAATPAAPAPAPEATATPVADATPATENSAPTATPPTASPMSSILVGPELQASINAIVEMGFAKEDVERAMRAAFNNPDRAVEYLMQGIPESVAAEARPAAPAAAAPAPPAATATRTGPGGPNAAPLDLFGGGGGGGGAAAGADAGGPMAALRNNPQFAQIRAMIQQDPSSLQRMLAELSAQNPALMQLLQQNQAEFLRMLAEPAAGGAGGNPAEALQQLMAARAMEAIEMTEEDEQAISRLQEMGFPREACIEAYFSCDKQEELAANLLLEGGMMDEG